MKKERNNFVETFGLDQLTLFTITLESCFPRGMFQGSTARYVLIEKRNRIVTEIDYAMQWMRRIFAQISPNLPEKCSKENDLQKKAFEL